MLAQTDFDFRRIAKADLIAVFQRHATRRHATEHQCVLISDINLIGAPGGGCVHRANKVVGGLIERNRCVAAAERGDP